jgi:exosortase A
MPDVTTRTDWRDPPAPPDRTFWNQWPARARTLGAEPLTVVFGLWAAVALAYWPSSVAFNWLWTNPTHDAYSHGYLVLASALWLSFRKRKALASVPHRPSATAGALMMVLSALWLWAWRAAIQDIHLLLVPAILFAAIAAVLGWRAARVLRFPIGFLYFAMPLWSDLHPPLQYLSSRATGVLMWIVGIPGYMRGNYIELPFGTLHIEQGCSGLHYLIVGLALGALYGELFDDPPRRRALWLAIMGAISLLTNWIRIFVVTAVAYWSEMRSPLVHHHYVFGWCLFVVAFMGFLWLAGRLQRASADAPPAAPGATADPRSPGTAARSHLGRAAVIALGLALLPVLSYSMDLARSSKGEEVRIAWPSAPAGWLGPLPVAASDWAPIFKRASADSMRRYVSTRGRAVEVFEVAYREQTQDAKLLGYGNTLLGADDLLTLRSQRTVDSPVGRWREWQVVAYGGTRSLIWSRYRIGHRRFLEPRLSQAWYGIAALTGRPVSSLTALRVICRTDCAAARRQLTSAAERLEPSLITSHSHRAGSAP